MNALLISVIVPVFNVERYLRRCLDSIVNQTYRNLEVIIVDDGSSDGSGLICDDYAARDNRIRIIHQENKGVAVARNVALDIATGDYILFVDSDDWIEKDTCAFLLPIVEEQQPDILYFGMREIKPSVEESIRIIDNCGKIEKTDLIRKILFHGYSFLIGTLIASKLVGDLRCPLSIVGEDLGLLIKLILKADNFFVTDKVFYNYNRRPESITSQRLSSKAIKDMILVFSDLSNLFQEDYPEFKDKMDAMLLREMIIGRKLLKNEPDYSCFMANFKSFVDKNKGKIKSLTQYSKVVWLYYYCRPLSYLYISIFFRNRMK